MPDFPTSTTAQPEAVTSTPSSVIRVLVIEDNADDQALLLRQLKKANIHDQVLFINDGLKAIEFLTQESRRDNSGVVAVFLDLRLPGASGLQILDLIRSSPMLKRLPVIVMTGSSNPADLSECQRLKVTGYIPKPVSFDSFCLAIANVFHQPATV